MLESIGFETKVAQDGQECVRLNAINNFDIIFMDVRMPYMDGISALEKLRLEGNSTPVILMSGYSQVSNSAEARELGASTFIQKPFLPNEVLKILAKVL